MEPLELLKFIIGSIIVIVVTSYLMTGVAAIYVSIGATVAVAKVLSCLTFLTIAVPTFFYWLNKE